MFCPTNSLKSKGDQFKIILNREKQQIFTVEELETANVWTVCLHQLSEWLAFNFLLINRALFGIISCVRISKREIQIVSLSSFSHINNACYPSHPFCPSGVSVLWTQADKSQTSLQTSHKTLCFACTWCSLWICVRAVHISYQQGSWYEGEHRKMKMTEQKAWTVYGWIIAGWEHKEMKMIEIKLAAEEQTNTSYPSKDRGVSLYISVAFFLSLFLNLSISVTVCLPLISLLTHSPYPFLHNNEIKNDPHSSL